MGDIDAWDRQLRALGALIRQQRRIAHLSLRELATLTSVSNAYLSQVERGLHQPSLKVLRQIAVALGVPPVTLLSQAGLLDGEAPSAADGASGEPQNVTERAIRADARLSDAEKDALVAVYRSYVGPAG